jgi:16S rRNA (guanine966-N2)-methyltransferase
LRIIAGEFKGKKLIPIKGAKIRPTSDKIKAAIFNILGSSVKDKKILDLFSGTGALGIEAVSRGARFCVFIDNDKYSLSIVNKNVKLCRIQNRTRIIKKDIVSSDKIIDYANYPFDILFLDPPYKENIIDSVIKKIGKTIFEDLKVTIIAEHSIKIKPSEIIAPFILYDIRKYGKTAVSFFSSRINKSSLF